MGSCQKNMKVMLTCLKDTLTSLIVTGEDNYVDLKLYVDVRNLFPTTFCVKLLTVPAPVLLYWFVPLLAYNFVFILKIPHKLLNIPTKAYKFFI